MEPTPTPSRGASFKWSDEEREEVRKMIQSGLSASKISARIGISRCAVIAGLLLCLFALPARAQFADVASAGGPVAIRAPWRFHTGDDLQWAARNFDDSQWPLIGADQGWSSQGYAGYTGVAGIASISKCQRSTVRWPCTSREST